MSFYGLIVSALFDMNVYSLFSRKNRKSSPFITGVYREKRNGFEEVKYQGGPQLTDFFSFCA